MPEKVRRYFDYWVQLGPGRGLRRVQQDLGGVSYPTLINWRKKYQWDELLEGLALGGDGDGGDGVDADVDPRNLNRETLRSIDRIIKAIQGRKQKTERDASALYRLIELRARVAQKIVDAEEESRHRMAVDFVTKLVDSLLEELGSGQASQ